MSYHISVCTVELRIKLYSRRLVVSSALTPHAAVPQNAASADTASRIILSVKRDGKSLMESCFDCCITQALTGFIAGSSFRQLWDGSAEDLYGVCLKKLVKCFLFAVGRIILEG